MKITETDAITGQTIERDPSKQELKQLSIDAAETDQAAKLLQAKLEAKVSAIAKLSALGLTEDEAKAIIG
jgi:hypothetical protein